MTHQELAVQALYRPGSLSKKDGNILPCRQILGQDSALNALNFALQFHDRSDHVFCLGPKGVGRTSLTLDIVRQFAATQKTPDDWVYVVNFKTPAMPQLLSLPAGMGKCFVQFMDQNIAAFKNLLNRLSHDAYYQTRVGQIHQQFQQQKSQWLKQIEDELSAFCATLVKTGDGFGVSPIYQGNTLNAQEFNRLPQSVRQKLLPQLEQARSVLQSALQNPPDETLEQMELQKAFRDVLGRFWDKTFKKLPRELINLPDVVSFIKNARDYVLNHTNNQASDGVVALLDHLRINPFVLHESGMGAPVIHVDHLTLSGLLGKIEHQQQSGSWVMDHTHIRPGALHLANGGFLLIEAREILTQPGIWPLLKRTLFTHRVHMESPNDENSLVGMQNLMPQDMPLSVQVILIGDLDLYNRLVGQDEDFLALFKLQVRFADKMPRTHEMEKCYAGVLADYVLQQKLLPFDHSAYNALIEWGSRVAQDQNSLSVYFAKIHDLMREAHYFAGQQGLSCVSDKVVQGALEQRLYRRRIGQNDWLQALDKQIVQLNLTDLKVGQINALVVCEQGAFAFGRPSRISCRVHAGSGQIHDVEQDVDLSGHLHTKGFMIMSSYLAATYGLLQPLPFDATIAWEQSYHVVEGDSASLAELYALMSAVGEIPMNQGIAVTGAVNQLGEVQAVGGLNDKIEGYFDACERVGLNGHQGVIIPSASVATLMLNTRVRQAIQKKQFHIWPISHVDEGLSILTGLSVLENNTKIHGAFKKFKAQK